MFRFLVVPFGVGGTGVAVPDEEEELLMLSISSAVTRWTLSKASRKAESSCSSKASRLLRMVPEKRTGSCGIIARRVLISWSFIVDMSIPSMTILPFRALRKRKRARESVDLPNDVVLVSQIGQKGGSFIVPAPVLPTTPTL